MLKAADLQTAGVDAKTAQALGNIFSGLTLAQILALLAKIFSALGGALPTGGTTTTP
jgi:hypothetical protein